MKRYMAHMISSAEKRVEYFLEKQVKEQDNCFYGGLEQEIIDVKPTVYLLATAAAVYCNPDSRFYKSQELIRPMNLALDFIRKYQREGGCFDYPSCNFLSAPDTAFCFKRLISTYRLFESFADRAATEVLMDKLLLIMKEALYGIRDGGFHTPNHRWAIVASLTQGAELFCDEEWVDSLRIRAAAYLQEGIDGNEDGEYAERSTGNYNAVVNQALISLYEVTKEEAYLGYVERNLHMMLTYIDPDDTIFTQNSTRQDRGAADYADKYFYQFLYMAAHTGNEEFDAAAHKMIQDNLQRGDMAPDCLHNIMLWKGIGEYELKGYGFPETYRKYYRDSGVLRVKKKAYTYSVLKGNRNFFYIKFGGLQVTLRIGESYCGIRNFIPQDMQTSENGCVLKAEAKGWYYQPFSEKPADSDWWKMDHTKRELLNSSELITTVELTEREKGIAVRVRTEGIDRLPLRVEMCIAPGSILESDTFCLKAEAEQALLLKDGFVTVDNRRQRIKIGPGRGSHKFAAHYSETEKEPDFCIRMNEYTPCDMEFCIEAI